MKSSLGLLLQSFHIDSLHRLFIYAKIAALSSNKVDWLGLAWLSHEKFWQYIWARIRSTFKATWMVTMPSYPIHRGRSRRPSQSIRARLKDF